ncbi:MAG: peptidase M50 [Desulfobacterales bacterium]
MKSSMYSPSWYRVAGLKPRLRGHMEIHRHYYRNELWYILQDHTSGRFQRFTPVAYQLIGLMDGERTVQEIWDTARSRLEEDAPTQEDFIRLLSRLHAIDALQADVVPDTRELLKRFEKLRFGKLKQNLRSPLFMRFSLLDPETVLKRLQPFVRPIFSRAGALVWLVMMCLAIFMAWTHWSELTHNIADRILSPKNLAILWLTFPFLKTFHEFAHAFTVKINGGEVHEMGIMMLVFTPIPYVDASAASAFHKRRERILVGGAGMAVELFIAALALFFWINMEPGPVRSLTYNIIFIAGVSSLFFNGNPLLRYDAYYMLADVLEIPNLAQRGSRYFFYLIQRYILRIKDVEEPMASKGERFWFVAYTIASFLYRMVVYAAIILFVAGKFFFIGVLFAIWGVFSMFILPAIKGLRFLFTSPQLDHRRGRATAAVAVVVFLLFSVVGLVPVPLATLTEGIMWVPERSFVRAGTNGFVDRILAEPGAFVRKGAPLIQCIDPLLPAQITLLEAQLREARVIYDTEIISDRVKAENTLKEMEHLSAKLEDARERVAELTVYSAADGVFIVPMVQDMPSMFVRRGQLLGYVLEGSGRIARVVVSQNDVDKVRQRTRFVDVRFSEEIRRTVPAVLKREIPAATDQLPGRALGKEGGGEIATDPRDMMGDKAFKKIFLLDIEMPACESLYHVGGRVYVRFDHGSEPLIHRWYRGLRQLFLRKFNV